ncbi:MAG: alpha-L-glutamate ligase-like protein [Gammaproteobacteria bacterium]|nr:alpha-L-glutamate ligase-like protein [Gammaproteobacteria bacterium]
MMGWMRPSRLRELGVVGMNRRNIEFISRYNDRRLYPLVDDKLRTKMLAHEHQLATPTLRLVIRQQHEIRRIAEKLEGLQGFAVKPAHGSGGRGILVVTGRRGERFVRSSGREMDLDDLSRHLSNIIAGLFSLGGTPDTVIIEDLIQIDPRFAEYSYQGIPDIRIIVFRGYPVMAMMRLATQVSDGKANLHQGAIGVGLDIGSGRAIHAVHFGRRVHVHPDTDAVLSGIQTPDWQTLLTLAARCHEVVGLGYIGADIVIDRDRGPLLLELNARPGLSIQVANGCGLLPRLRQVEALANGASAGERVAWSMQAFGEAGLAETGAGSPPAQGTGVPAA